jgi:hypothetical protein
MKALIPLLFSLVLLTGCGLIPKRVELFQSKVHKVPEFSDRQVEFQKRAAYLAKQRAADTVDAAISTGASTNVVVPARDAEKLTDAVSTSLGPPLTAVTNADIATANLRHATANRDERISDFKNSNDVNAGKKIEGTGLIQVPYFLWSGGFLVVIFVGWHLAKTALTVASAANPGAAVGVGAMNIAGNLAGKGLHQVVLGGSNFLKWAESSLDPVVSKQVTDAFIAHQKEAQDGDVKSVVKTLIN